MLPKINRLTKTKDFERVFKEGRSSYSKLIGIKSAPNDLAIIRFGILVGTKVSKKAVVRNKFKRMTREIIRSKLTDLKVGFDCIIITLPEIVNHDFDEIKKDLEFNFKRIKLLK